MAYYTAFVAAWTSVTQPPAGVTGAALTAGMTTAQKLAAFNAWTMAGPAVPMVIPTYKIYNLIVASEFNALTSTNQQLVRDILGMGTVDSSPGTQVRARMVALFPNGTTTFANLSALAATYDTPQVAWWVANSYPRAFDLGDCAAAGVS